jgi:hypothetical protein
MDVRFSRVFSSSIGYRIIDSHWLTLFIQSDAVSRYYRPTYLSQKIFVVLFFSSLLIQRTVVVVVVIIDVLVLVLVLPLCFSSRV